MPKKRIAAAALAVAAAVGTSVLSGAQLIPLPDIPLPGPPPPPMPNYTFQGPIEAKYAHTGPWATSFVETSDACDREGSPCAIFYPTRLGFNAQTGEYGFKHPVISIAGGTTTGTTADPRPLQDVSNYDQYLRHLASWGFVVVLTRDGWTSTGETVSDAADYMVTKNDQPGSRFYRKLDTANMGMMGFSQGGGSAAALLAAQNPRFKTYISGQGVGQLFGAILSIYTLDNPMSTGLLSLVNVSKGSIFYRSPASTPISLILSRHRPRSTRSWACSTATRIQRFSGIRVVRRPKPVRAIRIAVSVSRGCCGNCAASKTPDPSSGKAASTPSSSLAIPIGRCDSATSNSSEGQPLTTLFLAVGLPPGREGLPCDGATIEGRGCMPGDQKDDAT